MMRGLPVTRKPAFLTGIVFAAFIMMILLHRSLNDLTQQPENVISRRPGERSDSLQEIEDDTWEGNVSSVLTHYGDCEIIRLKNLPAGSPRAFLHLFIHLDRAREPERITYIENVWRFLSNSSSKIDMYITAMGAASKLVTLNLISKMRNPCNVLHVEFIPERKRGDLCEHRRIVMRAKAYASQRVREYEIFFFTNDGVRPFGMDKEGTWISRFKGLFSEGAVMAGPMVSCEVFPHVQTHFFAMSPQGLAYLEMMECGGTLAIQRYNREIWLSSKILISGDSVASFLYGTTTLPESLQNRTHGKVAYFHHAEPGVEIKQKLARSCHGKSNPSICFGGNPRDIIFAKWGGSLEALHLLPSCNVSSPNSDLWHCDPALKPNEDVTAVGASTMIVCDAIYNTRRNGF
ncbi:hypothetical protein AAMO2058_000257300 [Amorphochlora amoebiformis]